MLIPKTVNIGGLKFKVKRVKPSELEVAKEGEINFREQTITLCDAGTEYTNISFLHESIHGFMEALGITIQNQDEVLVDGLAHQLHEFLTTNKLQGV
jgi:hypothetical protein